ncbi:MAG: hypothetical protein QOI25_5243 [Mycobacterium sp.]|nr:hypothetical protein [Mycobacterium sp.]
MVSGQIDVLEGGVREGEGFAAISSTASRGFWKIITPK